MVTLDAGSPGATYSWSTGDTSQTINVYSSGIYWVTVSQASCQFTDSVNVDAGVGQGALYFPNTFTPDGNDLNEYFTGVGNDINTFHLDIWNRWGELIFSTDDMNTGWNGYYKNRLVPNDVYVYIATYTTACTGKAPQRVIGHVWAGR
jgi:gliding motility-associated-like protein